MSSQSDSMTDSLPLEVSLWDYEVCISHRGGAAHGVKVSEGKEGGERNSAAYVVKGDLGVVSSLIKGIQGHIMYDLWPLFSKPLYLIQLATLLRFVHPAPCPLQVPTYTLCVSA
jgi:hypothetical protein